MDEKICKQCNNAFKSKIKNQKFCSKKCSVIYNNIKRGSGNVLLKCAFCNKEFSVEYKHRHRKFCCHKCSSDFLKDPKLSIESRKKRSISHLGKIPYNKGKTYNDIFGKEKAEKIKNKICANRKYSIKNRIKLICLNCNKEFFVKYKYRQRKFCCHKCSSDYTKGKKRKPLSIETKQKMSNTKKGCIRKQSTEEIKNRRLLFIKKMNQRKENGWQMIPNWNNKACEYFKKFDEEHNTHGKYATNGGEYYIKELGYWLDYINEDLKIIIEWDESKHYTVDGTLKEKDKNRQNEIQEIFPDYEFRRIKE